MNRFLAVSGGGDRGLVIVGMLLELFALKGREAVNWSESAGISAGAFVCAYVSQLTPDTFEQGMNELKEAFLSGHFDLIKKWISGPAVLNVADALLYHSSIFSNEKLRLTIEKYYKKPLRQFSVGVFNQTKPCYETFSSTTTEDMVPAILASASVPLVFPPVKIGEGLYEDGGVRHIIPVREIKDWIERTHGDRHADILICYPINNRELFTQMVQDRTSFALLNNGTHMVSDFMLGNLERDIQELARIAGVSLDDMRALSCGKFSFKDDKGKVTLQIISPSDGRFTSFLKMDREKNQRLLESGKDIIKTYLKV